MTSHHQHFQISFEDHIAIVALTDPQLMDRLIVNELEEQLLAFIAEQEPSKMVVNFEGVRYCSSEIINTLLRSRKRLAKRQGDVKICCLSEEIQNVFRLLKLDGSVFEIYPTLESALGGFRAD